LLLFINIVRGISITLREVGKNNCLLDSFLQEEVYSMTS
jgi:hypothetical protein